KTPPRGNTTARPPAGRTPAPPPTCGRGNTPRPRARGPPPLPHTFAVDPASDGSAGSKSLPTFRTADGPACGNTGHRGRQVRQDEDRESHLDPCRRGQATRTPHDQPKA